MRTTILFAGLLLSASAVAQIPLPAFGNTFTSTLTRGFWFQAPVGFTITGLQVPNEANQSFQVVEVIDLGGAPPPAYPGTVVGTQLFYDNTTAAGNIIPCAIAIPPGAYIGILGACTSSPTSGTSYNSYAATSGPFTSSILGNSVTLTRFGTQSGIAANGGNQPCWQEAAGQLSRVEVYVGTGSGNFALAQPYGTGCDNAFASFYETFPANTFDLSNMSLQMIPTGTGYVVLPGSNSWWTPVGGNLGLTDDSVSGAQSLGFTLNYPGGSTTDVYVSSNGYVWAQPNTNNGCCTGDPATLLTLGARWCGLWNDLNPGAGGTVIFDQDTQNGVAYVTFSNVPEYGYSGNLNTFQYAFYASGVVEMRWQSCVITGHQALVGWSPGANNRNPGSMDLSALTVVTTAPDAYPLSLASSGRPVMGTSVNPNSTNVPAGSPLGATLFGFTEITAGLPLGFLGMPNCYQYLSLDASQIFFPAGGTGTQVFTVPNNAGLAGVVILSQSAAFAAGVNPLGVISSNGVRLTINPN